MNRALLAQPQYIACFLVFLFVLSYAPQVTAELKQDVERLSELIENDQGEAAYHEAQKLLIDYEGEPAFDFVYGLAAQAVGNYHQAVFSFERVVKNHPGWLKARYALATSYFASGNLVAAEREFNFIQQQNGSSNFPLIDKYLTAINKKKNQTKGHWQHQIELGVGHDDNANSGIEDELLEIPVLGPVALFSSSQPIEDQFLMSRWQSVYTLPKNLNTRWYGMASIKNSHYQDHSEMTRTYADIFVGWQSQKNNYQYHANIFYRPIWLDGENYLNYAGVNGSVGYSLSESMTTGVGVTLGAIDYQQKTQKNFDRSQWLLNFWLEKKSGKLTSRLTANGGEESVSDKEFDYLSRDYLGLQYRLGYLLNQQIHFAATIEFSKSDYQSAHPLFLQKREDELQKVSIEGQYYFEKNWSMVASFTYMDNQSELTLYDYDRTLAWIAMQYQF